MTNLRLAEEADLAACAALPTPVQSSYVWQVQVTHDTTQTLTNTEIAVALRCMRLPRPVTVRPSGPSLTELWQTAQGVLITEDGGMIAGYAVLTPVLDQSALTVATLVVAPTLRQRGLGSLLLRAAARWTKEQGFHALRAACPVRNHPAIACMVRGGLSFAGYSEAIYPRGDMVLLWQRHLS